MVKKNIILFSLVLFSLLISGCATKNIKTEKVSTTSLDNKIKDSIDKANIYDVYMERISWINHHYDARDYVTTLNVGDGKSMYPIFYPGNQLKVMAYFGGNLSKGEIACFYFEPYEYTYNKSKGTIKYTCHEIIDIDGDYVVAWGINNPIEMTEKFPISDVKYIVVGVEYR